MRKLQGGENQQSKAKWVADVRIIFELNVSRLGGYSPMQHYALYSRL